MDKCYMCNSAGHTKEHVPPLCFFPEGNREGLITVPSCPAHNLDNSRDVEYVRNVITQSHNVNELALKHFQDKVLGSYVHSPRLLTRTFRDSRPAKLDGQDTAIVPLEMDRFDRIMEAIAYALYFKDFGKTFGGKWNIWSTSLELAAGQNDVLPIAAREMSSRIRFQKDSDEKPSPQPGVFRYGIWPKDDVKPIYWLEFYGGFNVYALPER